MAKEELTKEFVIEQAKISHSWMLRTIESEELNRDTSNYSDELKHALLVQEMLERF